jgi:antitoxin component YwqK of YwqJK toxin-antitoxin module
MKQVLTIAVLILTVVSKAQDYEALRHCKSEEFKYDFYVLLKEKNIRFKDTVFYSWFRAQKIHHTQGQADGDILDGPFAKFYHSGQLAEQGEYDCGLKVGEWKSWRADGTLIEIRNYNKGTVDGKYFLYDELGKGIGSGKYRMGLKVEPKVHPDTEKSNTESTEEHGGSRRKRNKKIEEGGDLTPPVAESGDQANDEKRGFLKRIFGMKSSSAEASEDEEKKPGLFKRIFGKDNKRDDDKKDGDKKRKREKSNPDRTLTKKEEDKQ